MTDYDQNGWLIIGNTSDTYKVKCKLPKIYRDDPSATIINYPSDGHYGFSLNTRKREVRVEGLWFATTAQYEAVIAALEAGNGNKDLYIKIQISSTPSYWDWDGSNHYTMPVLWKKIRGEHKVYGGDTTIWQIDQIIFTQRAALS